MNERFIRIPLSRWTPKPDGVIEKWYEQGQQGVPEEKRVLLSSDQQTIVEASRWLDDNEGDYDIGMTKQNDLIGPSPTAINKALHGV